MLKKLNQIITITIGSFAGVFIGCGIYVFWNYKKHPDLYAMQSAPWYTSIFVYGIVMLIFVTVAVIAKLIIRKKMKEGINSTDIYPKFHYRRADGPTSIFIAGKGGKVKLTARIQNYFRK